MEQRIQSLENQVKELKAEIAALSKRIIPLEKFFPVAPYNKPKRMKQSKRIEFIKRSLSKTLR